jgi:hypothetical protein
MGFILDYETLVREHILRTGIVPSGDVIKMLELMIRLASTAYQQGQAGEVFDIGHGIPVMPEK